MANHSCTSDVLRHRHRFVSCWPQFDHTGLWLRITWACWTWDHLPPALGKRFVDQANTFRRGGL